MGKRQIVVCAPLNDRVGVLTAQIRNDNAATGLDQSVGDRFIGLRRVGKAMKEHDRLTAARLIKAPCQAVMPNGLKLHPQTMRQFRADVYRSALARTIWNEYTDAINATIVHGGLNPQ